MSLWTLIASVVAAVGSIGGVWYGWRAHRMTTDRSDVFWRLFRVAPDKFRVWNAGQDIARDARVILTISEHSYEGRAKAVPPNEGIEIDASIAGVEHRNALRLRKQWRAAGAGIDPPTLMTVRLHVIWRSRAGRWSVQDEDLRIDSALA